MRRILVPLTVAASIAAIAACDDPARPAESEVLSLTIDTTAIGLVRQATVTMREPGPARITWTASGAPQLALTADSSALVHTFLLPRLRQGKAYTVAASGAGSTNLPVVAEFVTDSLPADLRAIQINQIGQASLPVQLIEVVGATQFSGLLVVEDGQIVGWLRVAGSLFGATRRQNGHIVVLDNALGLVEYTLGQQQVRRLPHPAVGAPTAWGRIHHDAIATPLNSILFIANDTKVVGADTVTGEAIWEWFPETDQVVKRWTAFDFLDWSVLKGSRTTTQNWLHGNGLSVGPRGNTLMSLRNVDQVISIAPDFQSLEWTLGGVNGTLGISTADRFWGQHYVSEPTNGHVLIFDNGFERPGGTFSRVIEFQVDLAHDTVTKVWEYRATPEIYAALVGSARRLANGNTAIMFGMLAGQNASTGPVTAMEVNDAGVVQWRLTFGPQLTRLYRVTPLASLLGEQRVFMPD